MYIRNKNKEIIKDTNTKMDNHNIVNYWQTFFHYHTKCVHFLLGFIDQLAGCSNKGPGSIELAFLGIYNV
jgi:hypothetical protein